MCMQQCTTCGASIGNSVKKVDGLPPWDVALAEVYRAQRDTERTAIQQKYLLLKQDEDRNNAQTAEQRRREYEAYRRTSRWQMKRSKVIRRANGVCEGCMDAPATLVHHLEYSNIGDELLFQLVALCKTCHERAHPEHYEPQFWENDYAPCAHCRFTGGDGSCGKFGKPSFEALEAGGECGPEAKEFEGLR